MAGDKLNRTYDLELLEKCFKTFSDTLQHDYVERNIFTVTFRKLTQLPRIGEQCL